MQLQSFDFQGQALPLIHIDGRPAWLARDVGRILGYAQDGKNLVRNMTEKWADELMEGHDFDVMTGGALDDLRFAVSDLAPASPGSNTSIHPKARSTSILYQSGLNLVCLLSKKPLGRALRRWLADEVLPALAHVEPLSAESTKSRTEHDYKAYDPRELRTLAALMLKADMKPEAQRVLHLALAQLEQTQGPKTETPKGKRDTRSNIPHVQVNLRFEGLLPDDGSILKSLAAAYADAPPVRATDWIERFEAVGLGRLARARTPRGQATRIGLFLSKRVGEVADLGDRRVVLATDHDWLASKAPLYGFWQDSEGGDSLN